VKKGVRLAHERDRALILMDIQLPDPLCGMSLIGSIDLLPGTLDGASGKELGVNDLP